MKNFLLRFSYITLCAALPLLHFSQFVRDRNWTAVALCSVGIVVIYVFGFFTLYHLEKIVSRQ